jgi:energy-coupling factor transporter transmembrane protein EcfT
MASLIKDDSSSFSPARILGAITDIIKLFLCITVNMAVTPLVYIMLGVCVVVTIIQKTYFEFGLLLLAILLTFFLGALSMFYMCTKSKENRDALDSITFKNALNPSEIIDKFE